MLPKSKRSKKNLGVKEKTSFQDISVYNSWVGLMYQLWLPVSQTEVVDPQNFFHVIAATMPTFGTYQQQDAHEFLRFFCDRIAHELGSESLSCSNSPFSRCFGYKLLSEVKCLECNTTSVKIDPCLDVSLNIP